MKYSIITPVYNREDCIYRCIESVVRNLKWNVELEHIIVDDGSQDKTPIIVQEYATKYAHIKFIQFEKNRGTNASRNAAINAASGEYCILLDSDDYFVDEAIHIVNQVQSSHNYLHYFFLSDDTAELHKTWEVLKGKDSAVVTYEDLLFGRVDGDFIHIISTDVLRQVPFDEYLRINEGVFFMQFHRLEKEIWFTRKVITIRERSRSDSVSLLASRSNIEDVKRALAASSLRLNLFEKDLMKCEEGKYKINNQLLKIIDYNLLLQQYGDAKEAILKLQKLGIEKVPLRYKLIQSFHLGKLYYILGVIYIFIKYRILKKKIK